MGWPIHDPPCRALVSTSKQIVNGRSGHKTTPAQLYGAQAARSNELPSKSVTDPEYLGGLRNSEGFFDEFRVGRDDQLSSMRRFGNSFEGFTKANEPPEFGRLVNGLRWPVKGEKFRLGASERPI
jgi:hypothetical protein